MLTGAASYDRAGTLARIVGEDEYGQRTGDSEISARATRAPDRGVIPKSMRARVGPKPGAPLELRTLPVPVPKRGEVLIRVLASPINPSDLLMLSGDYGVGRTYPFVPGLEGAGEVVASGGGFLARGILGKRVACAPEESGLWSEYAVVPANRCVPLPKGMSAETGAMTFVNPLCAIALVETAQRDGHTAVVSTAAGGALGQMIRMRAQEKGIAVIDIVRRSAQAQALREAGAQHVLASDAEGFDRDLRDVCAQLGCRMAFDAVGGEMTGQLAEALEPNGEILVYGELSGKASRCNPATLTFKELTVRGFWLTRWSERQSFLRQLRLTRQIMAALRGGFAASKVNTVVPLSKGVNAPALYAMNMSAGKVLISPAAPGAAEILDL